MVADRRMGGKWRQYQFVCAEANRVILGSCLLSTHTRTRTHVSGRCNRRFPSSNQSLSIERANNSTGKEERSDWLNKLTATFIYFADVKFKLRRNTTNTTGREVTWPVVSRRSMNLRQSVNQPINQGNVILTHTERRLKSSHHREIKQILCDTALNAFIT